MNQLETLSQSLAPRSEERVKNSSVGILFVSYHEPVNLIRHLSSYGFKCSYYPFSKSESFNFKSLSVPLQQAQREGCNIVISIDNDGQISNLAARRSLSDKLQLLTFNQLAVIIANELIEENKDNGKSISVFKSLYITELLDKVVLRNDHKCSSFIGNNEEFEEYFLQHKDMDDITLGVCENQRFFFNAQSPSPFLFIDLIANLERKMENEGLTIFDKLISLYRNYGFYKEKTFAIDVAGEETRQKQFKQLVDKFKKKIPVQIGSQKIKLIEDFQKQISYNLQTGKKHSLQNGPHDIIRITLEEGILISLSQFENKISYHISIPGIVTSIDNYHEMNSNYSARILKYMELINQL